MSTWRDLIELAELTPQDVKERLDLAMAIEELGVHLTRVDDEGRYKGQCPFHDDDDPSLDVWVDRDTGQQRWGCHPCGVNADVFQFIQSLRDCSFPEAFSFAVSLLDAGLVYSPGDHSARPSVDLQGIYEEAASAQRLQPVAQMLADREVRAPVQFVAREFQVAGDDKGDVVVPHLYDPGDGRGLQCSAIKRRMAPTWTPPMSLTGSKLTHLYGEWRDRGPKDHPVVVVCEGESDTWLTAWAMRERPEVLVLGLPSGAGARVHPEWGDRLAGRHVVLLFDSDHAGREGARRWVESLPQGVRVASLPDGEDAVTAGEQAVREAVDGSLEGKPSLGVNLIEGQGKYLRPPTDDKDPVAVSDFTLTLTEAISVEGEDGGLLFRVRLPSGEVADLEHPTFNSDSQMRKWANRHGYRWLGTTKDTQELMALLKAEAPYVPRLIGTRVAGFHHGAFVLPGLTIGPRSRTYVPPIADVRLEQSIRLDSLHRPSPETLLTLSMLHRADVTTPILGWIGATPLRALFEQFPILAVVGGAGLGKTTLLHELLSSFGFEVSAVLTSTTPHAVGSFAAATNGIPVWFDEYRAGARDDSRMRFEQVLRDAWDGKASVKGGLQENRQALTALPATAPIVVTGEDAFTETSHHERMVTIQLPREGRQADALQRLWSIQDREGLGRAYLEWLQASWAEGVLPAQPRIANRAEHGLAVASWGYDLLRLFAQQTWGYDLPAYDDSLPRRMHLSEADVHLELLREALNVEDRSGNCIVWQEADDLLVRGQAAVTWAKRETDLRLPGGYRAVMNWYEGRFPGAAQERTHYGRALRLPGAADIL